MLPHSVTKFREKMVEFADGEDVYGVQYIKKLLKDRYQDHISFCCEPGPENILYFKQMTEYFINTKYKERGNTAEEESQRIMALAANLVKAEVREEEYKNDFYPDPNESEALNWSPPLLKQLMKDLTKSDLKQEFLAQCIVKTTKRDVIPSLLFACVINGSTLHIIALPSTSQWVQLRRLYIKVASNMKSFANRGYIVIQLI